MKADGAHEATILSRFSQLTIRLFDYLTIWLFDANTNFSSGFFLQLPLARSVADKKSKSGSFVG